MSRFGVALKYIRKHTPYTTSKGKDKAFMTTRDVSKESGISPTYISTLEQPDNKVRPSAVVIGKLAKGLTVQNGLNPVTMQDFLCQMAAYENPDPRTALKVCRALSNVNFKDFLQYVVGYMGMVKLEEKDEKVAEDAFKNWDQAQLQADKDLIREYQMLDKRLFLSKAYDPKVHVVLDNKPLSASERVILNSTIKTIRELRKK